MNKEKYFEFRKIESEINDSYRAKWKIKRFFEENAEYISKLKSKEVEEAIKSIERYQKLLDCEIKVKEKEVGVLIDKFEKGCEHDILFRGLGTYDLKPTGDYMCPLCRKNFFSDEVIPNDRITIDVPALFNHESPSQCDYLYLAVDYIIKNDLEWSEESFDIAFKEVITDKHIYNILKDDGTLKMYKVRRKV